MFGKYLRDTLAAEGVDTKGGVYHRRFGRLRGQQQRAEVKQLAAVDKLKIDLAETEIEIRAVFPVKNEIPFALAAYPNWRERLWESKEAAVKAMRSVLMYVDVIKVSEAELQTAIPAYFCKLSYLRFEF